jgi:hypothetical protein
MISGRRGTKVKVLGETFSIKERKLRTQGIRFTNANYTLKELEYINALLGHLLEYT